MLNFLKIKKRTSDYRGDLDEDTGTCFDFAYDDIDDILYLLNKLKEIAFKLS